MAAAAMDETGGSSDDARACPRGHWRPAEDEKLRRLVEQYGPHNWNSIAEKLQGRSGKSCRLRWFNQLDPRINRRPFSEEEEERLMAAHRIHGNKWALISRLFPGRTDNAVKNHWHVLMARRQREQSKMVCGGKRTHPQDDAVSRDHHNHNQNRQNLTSFTSHHHHHHHQSKNTRPSSRISFVHGSRHVFDHHYQNISNNPMIFNNDGVFSVSWTSNDIIRATNDNNSEQLLFPGGYYCGRGGGGWMRPEAAVAAAQMVGERSSSRTSSEKVSRSSVVLFKEEKKSSLHQREEEDVPFIDFLGVGTTTTTTTTTT